MQNEKRKRNQADSAGNTITAVNINSCLKPGKKQKRDKNTGGGEEGASGWLTFSVQKRSSEVESGLLLLQHNKVLNYSGLTSSPFFPATDVRKEKKKERGKMLVQQCELKFMALLVFE